MKVAGITSPALGIKANVLPRPLARKSSSAARCTTLASRKHDGHEQSQQGVLSVLAVASAVLLLSVSSVAADISAPDLDAADFPAADIDPANIASQRAPAAECEVPVQQNKSQDAGSGDQRQGGLQRSASGTAAPYTDFGQVAPTFGRVGGFLRSIEEEMNNMLQAMTTGNLDQAPPELRDVLVPLHVDIQDKDNEIVIKADTPGLTSADLTVVLDPDTKIMTISGEREVDRSVDDQGEYVRVERKAGRFERRFKLPDAIDPNNITAKVTHGVLEVHVPKTAPAKDKQQRIDVT